MKRAIRVAMIIQAYHPRIGGAERQLRAVAPWLQEQDVEVQVLTRRYRGLAALERIDGIPVYRLPVPRPKPIASLTFTATALALLGRLRPDIIHAHGLLSPATTAVAAKRIFGPTVVVTVHDRGPEGELARIRRRALSGRRIRALRDDVDAFVVISQEVDRELAQMGVPSEKRPFIPNGVDPDWFAPVANTEKRALRARLSLPDVPITIYTGRLVPGKQLDRLIEIWDSVRAARPDALLLLVGSGSQESALRQAAGRGVMFVDSVEDVAPFLQASDLFVLPSASEGLSVALLEAMSTGLPAVATAVGGNLDLIQDQLSGRLVPADDFRLMRDVIVGLLADPDRRARLGRRERDRVLQGYTLSGMAAGLRALYDRLLTGPGNRQAHAEESSALAMGVKK